MFLVLVGLHHLADVAFQPSWLIENKKKYVWAHYEHAMLWACIISLGLFFFNEFTYTKFFFLLIGHAIIDYTFYVILPAFTYRKYGWVWIDQALHYAQLAVVVWI